jgi:ribonuclease P protein component
MAAGKAKERLATLKRRSDFLRLRKGARWSTPGFVLEAMQRSGENGMAGEEQPRYGFTVTKQIGGAVERNRIRRRLKAAVRSAQMAHARPDFDYVLIARPPALHLPYIALVRDLEKAFDRVHRRPSRRAGERK